MFFFSTMSSSPASPPAPSSRDETPSNSPIIETSVAETSPESSSSSDAPTSSDPEDVGSALSSDPDPEGGGAASTSQSAAAAASETEAASASDPKPGKDVSSAEPEVGLHASEPRDTDSDDLCDSASADSSTSPNSSTSPKKQTSATQPPRSYVTSLSFPGVEAHIKEHSFPLHIASCGICHYWKNRVAWSARASFLEKASGKRLSWLACSSVGQALCWPCASCSVGRDRFARGTGRFKHSNLLRHQRSKSHLNSIKLWNARSQAGDDGVTRPDNDAQFEGAVAGSAANLNAAGTAANLTHPRLEASDFVCVRTLLETRCAFRNWDAWVAAAGGTSSGRRPPVSECKRGFSTLASLERLVTHEVLKAGVAYWLQADGLGRAYQAGIGAVVWKFPASVAWLLQPGLHFSWLLQLGDRGPWLVERLLGAREFPAEMNTAAKVQMLVDYIRRAAQDANGDVDLQLRRQVCSRALSWASDGQDRAVGDVATEHFPSMVFRVWEESHSAVKVLAHAVTEDPEVRLIDALLVSGKDPPSLAKFLSTSEVYRRRCADAQSSAANGVSLCENFGWAPQRFASRARPLAREARRWDAIWDSLATEAGSASKSKRRENARYYLQELGGANAPRLLLGGMLTDISVEHYHWVAGGDKNDPDPTTVTDRANLFLQRLHVLFDQGLILTLKETYTGEVLRFLRRGKIVYHGKQAPDN